MMNFISLGSGSSGNCYFLYTEDDGLMIDVGIGIRLLKKYFHDYGLPLSRIKHVLLTHDHADHVKSVGSLSHDFELPVYSTQKVHAGIGNNYCVRKKIDSKRARFIEKDRTYTMGAFQVTPFGVPHDSSDNVGYFITHEGVNFCLVTDVGHVTERIKEFIGKADYLVLEANYDREMLFGGTYPQHLKDRINGPTGHLCNHDCGLAIAENATPSLQHVWLCHLSEENNHPELARITVEQVLRDHGIIAGKDFALEVLKRTKPSGVYELKKSGMER
ncbi:MAG: MBL fold metallo-hydrolase [Bacteroidales bacterium]|nr:MBL fold metallo-hydrolase [Bacteroidales bacterium]